MPGGSVGPPPSELPGYASWLDRALAARRDVFEHIVALAVDVADHPDGKRYAELERRSSRSAGGFDELSSVLAGAYLMHPDVREAIGYPGQAHRVPRFDEAAEQILDGILDPVIERGPVYRDVPTASRGV